MDSLIPFTTSGSLVDCVDSTSAPLSSPECLVWVPSSPNTAHPFLLPHRKDACDASWWSQTSRGITILWSIRYIVVLCIWVWSFYLTSHHSKSRSWRHYRTHIPRRRICRKESRLVHHQGRKCRFTRRDRELASCSPNPTGSPISSVEGFGCRGRGSFTTGSLRSAQTHLCERCRR